jgi:hypothetical protein
MAAQQELFFLFMAEMTVKDLLKKDLPPTHADAVMRKKHTLGSVQHNLNHDDDHSEGAIDALEKLYTVDSAKAKSEAKRVIKQYENDVVKVKDLLRGWE